jgi:hypothetical protein
LAYFFDDEPVFGWEPLSDQRPRFRLVAGDDIADLDISPSIIEITVPLMLFYQRPHILVVYGHLVDLVSAARQMKHRRDPTFLYPSIWPGSPASGTGFAPVGCRARTHFPNPSI